MKEKKWNKEIGQIENENKQRKKENKTNLFTEKKKRFQSEEFLYPEANFSKLMQFISYLGIFLEIVDTMSIVKSEFEITMFKCSYIVLFKSKN